QAHGEDRDQQYRSTGQQDPVQVVNVQGLRSPSPPGTRSYGPGSARPKSPYRRPIRQQTYVALGTDRSGVRKWSMRNQAPLIGEDDRVNPLRQLTLDQLRARTSEKWRAYPPDVLPVFVAEMDVPLAEPVARTATDATTPGDTGHRS